MTMPARSALTSGDHVAGMLCGECAFRQRCGTLKLATRLRRYVVVVQSCGRRRMWRYARLASWFVLVGLTSPMVIVTTMAHFTTTPAKAKERECTRAMREPDRVAAKPVHRIVHSVASTEQRAAKNSSNLV